MKSQMIRISLLLSWGLLLMLGLLSWGVKEPDPAAAYSPPNVGEAMPNASFHLWQVNEIFSCADGSAQFVEFFTTSSFETQLNNKVLRAVNSSGTVTHTFTFTKNLTSSTANQSLLIATANFSNLSGAAGITPDFTLPDGFLFTTEGAKVELVNAVTSPLIYSSGELPLDGVTSLGQGGATTVNSPKNFAGQTGSVSCPATPDLTLSKTAAASGTVEAGGVLTYTIRVENSSAVTATNALITDTVPLSTTYIPGSASDGGIFNSGVISWANLTISPATTLTRTFQVTVSLTVTTGDKITNTAFITSTEGSNDEGSIIVTVGSDPAGNKVYLPIILKNS